MVKLANHIPYEFARKPRSLKEIKYFKATEWRQILLYTGVIFLKDYVHEDVHKNFVVLHVAISILSNPVMCKSSSWVDYAEKLLIIFVKGFRKLYGRRYVSYNVHGLLHLSDDVRKYGELDNFSAFRFENFIGQIKRLIRSGNKTLQQLSRRFIELENVKNKTSDFTSNNTPFYHQQHDRGPLPQGLATALQYKIGFFESFQINCDDDKNSYVYIENLYVVKVLNFFSYNKKLYLLGKTMDIIGPLYEYLCSSSNLGINIVNENGKNPATVWNINKVTAKVLMLPHKTKKVAFPILHTISEYTSL